MTKSHFGFESVDEEKKEKKKKKSASAKFLFLLPNHTI